MSVATTSMRRKIAAVIVIVTAVGLALFPILYHPSPAGTSPLPGPRGGGASSQTLNGTITIIPPTPPSVHWSGLNGWCHGMGQKLGIEKKATFLGIKLPTC